ncbi:putative E3 ubiquitin-protein ligase RING1a [Acorus calamus]|uniref:E3 ubiquitin-protein ligase RING1a n=1 Tax=Acorus calamus TaxID=4465 RepID=A0AAV9CA14_ACOCL|nr:putative E3 ubiquitin-protein ligase RING1a [Acorus calamus]
MEKPRIDERPDEEEEEDEEDDVEDEAEAAATDDEGFIIVNLADVRNEVQCPICLGIIRKTRTVMECLHRFCRECIDKSMRLGNNECPACRTHCASRRSLRDDPNYDALIAALYPDIDKYEEEELAFHEAERARNKLIQETIAQTVRRQSEALGRRRTTAKATAAAFARRSRNGNGQNSYPRGRRRTRDAGGLGGSDVEDEEGNGNDGGKYSSSAEEPCHDVRPKRSRRWSAPWPSNLDGNSEENDDAEVNRDWRGASPGKAGAVEALVWGRGGTRSHTRYGSLSGSSGKNGRGNRISRLVEYLRTVDADDDEYDIHLTLLPADDQTIPSLQRPHLCCRPTLFIRQLCQFVALQTSLQAEEVEILVAPLENEEKTQILGAEETLLGLYARCASRQGDLVLLYRTKSKG